MSVAAVQFGSSYIMGITTEVMIGPYEQKYHDRSFTGVSGTSRIYGQRAKRRIVVQVFLVDEASFLSPLLMSDYIDTTLNQTLAGTNASLNITSESDHPVFGDCTFEGATIREGPKPDESGQFAGTWWSVIDLEFTQLS